MTTDKQTLNLSEAASRFLASLPGDDKGACQQEVFKFARWFGLERPLAGLTAAEVDNYAERLSLSDAEYQKRLELVRAFLLFAKKKGWSETNLAVHLKPRRGKPRSQPTFRPCQQEPVYLTREGRAKLETELVTLQRKRMETIDEIRKAAADKDFRENVPLQAAREQKSHLEGQIMELEETLKAGVTIDEKQEATLKVGIGDSVVLCEPNSGKETRYTLVSPKEADPSKGKISSASPIGKAITGKSQGETVEVAAPAGKLRYQIKAIER
ncbi:MAG: transcription elongation factor GreA [Chloroflexi bacterium]|nr:transcription elongation factor GreA [Chloroflexota bacterium]